MSVSYWLDGSKKSKKTYDYIIVGGGIAGLSTAYWLQKKDPKGRIALIEKDRIGFGASGRNAGFVTCGSTEHFIKLQEKFGLSKAVEIWKFSETNRNLLKDHIIQDQAKEVDFKQTGSCTVAPSDAHWEKYQETAKVMRAHQIQVQEVHSRTLESSYGVTGFKGGIEYLGDGEIHPVKLLNLLCSKLKIDLFENTEVFAIEDGGETQNIKTDQGTFVAPRVLLTLNAYLPLVLKNFSQWVIPHRGQVLVTEPLPPFVKGPCYLTKHLCYFRQLPGGELLIGGFRNLSLATENNWFDQTTDIIQEALLKFTQEHFKFGAQAKIAYQWSGVMGFTPDEQMIIGSTADNPNIHVMAGCAGHGMGLSFHAAQVLVDHLFGKAVPDYLDIRRFQI